MATLFVLRGPDKGQTFHTADESAVLGRDSEQIPLTDHSISRRHACMRKVNGAWTIEDSNSSNGTYLNGTRLHETATIKDGDQIRLGGTLLVFAGEESVQGFAGTPRSSDLVELDDGTKNLDSSILASATASDESVILASPETSQAVHSWNVIYQIAETIGTFVSVEDLLERMTDIIFKHLHVDRIFILMRDGDGGDLTPQVVRYRNRDKGRHRKITTSRRIINHVLQNKEGVLCANAQADVRFSADAKDSSIHRLGLRSVICVPILTSDQVAGIIHLDCNMANHTYTQQQLLLATTIGRMAGMAIENARLLQSRMEHERLAAVGETVANLSHSIRNILQGMRSGADVIEMGLKKRNLDNVGSGWQIVQRNLERTYRLATNMLTFSKERQPQIQMAQLNTVIEDVIGLTRRQAQDKGAELETELGDIPAFPLDIDGIHQVAANIIINAIDAVPQDQGRILVATRYDPSAQRVTLSISDNGPGIPDDELDRIFDAFHSTKGHRGTGLGLAAAQKIVAELDGRIEVNSSPQGTTFLIHLDTTEAEEADSGKTHGPPQ